MGRLEGKVALITGAARGQGASEGRLFAAEGAKVVLTDVRDDEGTKTASEIGDAATYMHHDVTDEEAWRRVVADVLALHGRIDVLVNNAGIVLAKSLRETTQDEYMHVIAINQVGVFLGMKAVAETMEQARSGSIINISSVSGLIGLSGQTAYAASKWAVRGMTKVAAKELAPAGVRVNSIHPGLVDTQLLREAGVDDDMMARLPTQMQIPAGRVAVPEDIAQMALYLASDESAYSTGAEFVVDGGWTA